jgi:hypothetical protein
MAGVSLPNIPGSRICANLYIESDQHRCSANLEESSFELGKQWIKSCEKHPFCKKARPHPDPSFRPTRLIKVIGSTSARLVETSKEDTSAYLALSHCWGKPDATGKTTFVVLDSRDTMDAWTASIPVEDLAKNFQDAIRITFGLGLEYLWIDSICIIQRDREDWEIESAKMGYVYANAICTISATASNNAHGGCFFPVEQFQNDCVVGIDSCSSLAVGHPSSEGGGTRQLFRDKVELAPLNSRAWCFQERVLSKRVLHFSRGVLLFECNTMLASEYQSQGVPHHEPPFDGVNRPIRLLLAVYHYEERAIALVANSIKFLFRFTLTQAIPAPFVYLLDICLQMLVILTGGTGGGVDLAPMANNMVVDQSYLMFPINYPEEGGLIGMRTAFQVVGNHPRQKWSVEESLEFHQQWFELVGPFSARDLTNHTDRLVAIIGVATFIQEQTGTRFLAGLWEASLAWNLLWVCDAPNKARRRSAMLPSWSWASVDGRIRHEFPADEVSAQQTALNATRLEDIVLFTTPASWQIIVTKEQSSIVYNATLIVDKCLLVELENGDTFLPDIQLDRNADLLFIMPIVGAHHGRYGKGPGTIVGGVELHFVGGEGERMMYGIVLRKVAGSQDMYERVGYFSGLEEPILKRERFGRAAENYRWRHSICIK